jgi:hypothetical protein
MGAAEIPWLTARWLGLDTGAQEVEGGRAAAVVGPGETKVIRIHLTAPDEPGDFLLILDVDSPGIGALASQGVTPGLVRVEVVRPAARTTTARRATG